MAALISARNDEFDIEHTRLANRFVDVESEDLKDRVQSLTVKLDCIRGEALNIHCSFFAVAQHEDS